MTLAELYQFCTAGTKEFRRLRRLLIDNEGLSSIFSPANRCAAAEPHGQARDTFQSARGAES